MHGRYMHSMRMLAVAGITLITACDGSDPTAAPLFDPIPAQLSSVATRPLVVAITGHANPDFSLGPCNVINEEAGTGIGQHLGALSWTSEEVANFCVDPNDPERAEVTGAFTMTASNGDRITGTYVTVVLADFAAGTLTADGEFVITGGTGRFTEASGSGAVHVTGSLLPPFDVAGTFTGTITY